MKITMRAVAMALATLILAVSVGAAQAGGRHGGHGGHYWGPGVFWGAVGLGVGIGVARHHYYYSHYGPPWYPGYVAVEPPPVAYYQEPQPATRRPPDPIFYPREGQTAAQTEADRQACNRWAMTQPNAMAEAGVFHRATLACMEGRGYTVR